MNTDQLLAAKNPGKALVVFIVCMAVLLLSCIAASRTQQDFGRIRVTNVSYPNANGIALRAKLLKPANASLDNPVPGVVYIHGYQNNRETGDAYCIEAARRGIAVLNIDAIGRGNSGLPGDPGAPDFDDTYGGRSSLAYLRTLPFVDGMRTGMMGHSLGARMAYEIALTDPSVQCLIISGFAYTLTADRSSPRNMLMIFGKWDEYRQRMTGTKDFETEWMQSSRTGQVIDAENPNFGVTYGSFADGSARRVFMPGTIHVQESHDSRSIAQAVLWMKSALAPDDAMWIEPGRQIWPVKEWATLTAMLAAFAALLPLGLMVLRMEPFRELLGPPAPSGYTRTGKAYVISSMTNGLLMWLYLPIIYVLFGIHVYLVHIDKAFPLMMANGVIWWFFWINVIGGIMIWVWYRKNAGSKGLDLLTLGISYDEKRLLLHCRRFYKTILVALVLFLFTYGTEHVLESIFIVDYRVIFPFASDLTPERARLFPRYFPFVLVGFVLLSLFLHGQMRRPLKSTWLKTFLNWSVFNVLLLAIPLILLLAVQYFPLFSGGNVLFTGPGGMFVSFMLMLFHMIGLLIMLIPLSTWFFQLTGRVYLSAFLNALIVTWMFASSQVIAPIPI